MFVNKVNTICKTFRKMSGQAKISSFFTSTQQNKKRQHSGHDKSEDKEFETEKKQKLELTLEKEGKENCDSSEVACSLSPEQRLRIQQNKLKAQERRRSCDNQDSDCDIGKSWKEILDIEFEKPYFVKLNEFVKSERSKGKVFPPAEDVFSWTRYCSVDDVKVVILGQDPYHGPNQAHGLCFSVQKGIPPPPSLLNMYKELAIDIEGFKHPGHGTLTGWAEQGVLLLNAVLTVRAHQANSHKDKGWEKFTDSLISWLNKNREGIVFILWGSYAQKKGAQINKSKHHVLKGVHPSPLSAHRGYFGCKHFSKCNEFLKSDGKDIINWNHLPAQA